DDEVGERMLDPRGGYLARLMRIDRRFHRRRGDEAVVKAIAAGVQELQHDAPACLVHRARDGAMTLGILWRGELRAVRRKVARVVRRIAARHDERGAAAR